MPKVDVFNLKREKVGELELSDDVFGTEVKEQLFYEVVKASSPHGVRELRPPRREQQSAAPPRRSTAKRARAARATARFEPRCSPAVARPIPPSRATGATAPRGRCASARSRAPFRCSSKRVA